MKSILPLLAFMLALPASAQERFEAALTYDKVQGKAQSLAPISFEPKDNSALGLSIAWSPWKVGNAQAGLTAAFRARGSSDLVVAILGTSEASGDYRYEHMAIGGRLLWRTPFDFGVGLQCRFEKVVWVPKGEGETWSGHLARPWITAEAGYTFQQNPAVKPFAAISVALPLSSESQPTSPALTEAQALANQAQLVKASAPRFELALKAGLRF